MKARRSDDKEKLDSSDIVYFRVLLGFRIPWQREQLRTKHHQSAQTRGFAKQIRSTCLRRRPALVQGSRSSRRCARLLWGGSNNNRFDQPGVTSINRQVRFDG